MEFNAEFFVAVAFVVFLCGFAYLGVHSKIVAALDARVKSIVDELEQAKGLRKEAADLLASFEAKRAAAEVEAVNIVAHAKTEAEAFAKEAERRVNEFITRRTAQADAKIAVAETQAAQEVRASAADAAVRAAGTVLHAHANGPAGAGFIEQGIAEIKSLLN